MAKIKVSQATIDKIKKQGMSKALAGAGSANAEMREGLRRMYGQARLDKAMGTSSKPRATSADAARAANKPVRYKSADVAKSAAVKKATPAKPKTRPTLGGFAMLPNIVGAAKQKKKK